MPYELEEPELFTTEKTQDDINPPRLEYDLREDYHIEEDNEDDFQIVEEEE